MRERYILGEIIEVIGYGTTALVIDAAPNRQKLNIITSDGEYLIVNNTSVRKTGKIISNQLFKQAMEPCDKNEMAVGCLYRDQYKKLHMMVAFKNNNFASLYCFKDKRYINGYFFKGAMQPLGIKVNFEKLMKMAAPAKRADL